MLKGAAQSVVHGAASSASPGNVFNMQTLGPTSHLLNPTLWWWVTLQGITFRRKIQEALMSQIIPKIPDGRSLNPRVAIRRTVMQEGQLNTIACTGTSAKEK